MSAARTSDPGMRDRSLFHVLASVEVKLQTVIDSLLHLGERADNVDGRLEAVERACNDCQRSRDECHARIEAERAAKSRTLGYFGALWKSAPIQWAIGALLLIAVTLLARCAGVDSPLLPPAVTPAPLSAPAPAPEVPHVPLP